MPLFYVIDELMKTTIRQSVLVGLMLVVAAAVGCSTEEPLPPSNGGDDGAETTRRVGSLLAEFEHAPDRTKPRVKIHAQFLDAKGVPVDTAFEALEMWSSDSELDRDACSMETTGAPPVADSGESDIRLDLLSVGPITVDGPARRLELEARRLPDLVTSFSGVIYGTDRSTTRTYQRLEYEPGADYTFHAPGSTSAGGFEVTLKAPKPVRIEAASGKSGSGARDIELRRGRDFKIRWNTPKGTHGAIFFDVASGYGPDRPRLKCRLEDDGSFTLPGDIVSQLAENTSSLNASIRRVQSKDIDVPGLQDAEFNLSTVDRLTLHLE